MKTLLERLKPEIKLRLEANTSQYTSTIDNIFENLSSKVFYQDLTMSEISRSEERRVGKECSSRWSPEP